ncbi:hypothetical protein ACFOLC_04675 [Lysobacter cavernae]|uniref:Uncharacterized protein n=1 Tax=Lysobacter cavernae TaxID=1685901 RepID=A0ABV7RKY2_9GAMM
MKNKLTIGLMLALAAGALPAAAVAGDGQSRALAEAAGITEYEVRMLMGWSPLTYYEFRSDHGRIERKIARALGDEFVQGLLAGKPMRLTREVDGRVVVVVIQRDRRS